MTLDNWVRNGGNMLSHHTSYNLCRQLGIREKDLREMDLIDIYAVPGWGDSAKREIDRFSLDSQERDWHK